ncbi:DUF3616 domain-containing protein [Oscillatoria amoena NRMC-F 0135]|nr:DUF3616 domain-containing protein [Geitlerinema splendidum]MDL5047557.1 DUF3616 domain-containing protein [Oscillatoria amoena NRMC-F 0135]
MKECFLLSRLLLRFDSPDDDLTGELSAIAHTPDGYLWVGSDEYISIERLSPTAPYMYGEHKTFHIGDFVPLFDDNEIDIEGIDYSEGYLWFTGSHSTKRKKPKGKDLEKDLKRLATVTTDLNRFIIARIPLVNGDLVKSGSHPQDKNQTLTAACLETIDNRNLLIEVLTEDRHIGPFIKSEIPSKDNGFDIEGLAVRGNRVFLGLRGPVLRGWAILVELEMTESEPGVLTLKPIDEAGKLYKKHFVNLNGLGVRELCWLEDDLIILSGPTMEVAGEVRLFRLKDALNLEDDSISDQDTERLEILFDLPYTVGGDKAEGLALVPCLDQARSLLVLYDSPLPNRRPDEHSVYADLFRLD